MRIHLVGVGGISMRALGRYLVDAGHQVSGCDTNSLVQLGLPDDPGQVAVRTLLGFPIQIGHDRHHVATAEEVIINSAITDSHPGWVEVLEARKRTIPVLKRAQKIGQITRERETFAITGTHGKSTTTGMAAKVAVAGHWDPFVMIGARVPDFANQTYRPGKGPLILEADEFDRSFHQFRVARAIITNIEADHLDYYTGGLNEIIDAFAQFMQQVTTTLILFGDDANVMEAFRRSQRGHQAKTIVRYGRDHRADYQLTNSHQARESNSFSLRLPGGETVSLALQVPGLFNQENAAAVFALTDQCGLPRAVIKAALEDFRGVGIRFEIKARTPLTTIISDYGHHPTELRVTIAAAEEWFRGQPVTVVFQPHQYARTRLLFDDFVAALAPAHAVFITDIFGVAGREDQVPISAQDLVVALQAKGTRATYLPVARLVPEILAVARQGGVFLMIGAGLDIREAAEAVARELSAL